MAKVTGADRFERRLKRIPASVRTKLDAANRQSAEELAAMQKRLAPRNTGKLADSIAVTPPGGTPPPYGQGSGSARRRVPETTYVVTVGNEDVRYAHLVEFGTRSHPQEGRFAGTEHPGVAPQPFFYPPWRALKKGMKRRARKAMRDGVRATK